MQPAGVQEVQRRKQAADFIATTWKSRRQARYNRLLFRLTLTIKHHMGPAVRRARLRLRQRAAGEAMLLDFQIHTQDWGLRGQGFRGAPACAYPRGQHVRIHVTHMNGLTSFPLSSFTIQQTTAMGTGSKRQ